MVRRLLPNPIPGNQNALNLRVPSGTTDSSDSSPLIAKNFVAFTLHFPTHSSVPLRLLLNYSMPFQNLFQFRLKTPLRMMLRLILDIPHRHVDLRYPDAKRSILLLPRKPFRSSLIVHPF